MPVTVSSVEMLEKVKLAPITRLQLSSSTFNNKYNTKICHCLATSLIFNLHQQSSHILLKDRNTPTFLTNLGYFNV